MISSIPFQLLWRSISGQSAHLILQRSSVDEVAVNFKVVFKQGGITVYAHVVQEIKDVSVFLKQIKYLELLDTVVV